MTIDAIKPNWQTINLQIAHTQTNINNLKTRVKNKDFKHTPVSSLKECVARAKKALTEQEENLKLLHALRQECNERQQAEKLS